ncbi:MAG: glycosyltransferase family 2 protein [Betaproteobacteria bacterium]|nr:glycosyltransferase family 2 protein [Betaproteobacteria bacterium]
MNTNETTIGIVIPTYNGGSVWERVVEALQAQRSDFDKILVIDSGSTDNTVTIARKAGFTVKEIFSHEFNHGSTRNSGLLEIDCDIVVFLTQDAIPSDNAISTIAKAFDNESVAVAYGRQLPRDDATPVAKHARLFNYGENGYTYELSDKNKYGIKTAFLSNSFSAYKTKHFIEIGGFCDNSIFAEDMHFTAKALLSGYKVCYVENATCMHSHNYSPIQEFKRYFDIGVFHKNESWIRETFGTLKGEGAKFILSELSFLWKQRSFLWILISFVNNFFKILGYKTGLHHKKLPRKLAVHFSTCKPYWSKTQ